MMTKSVSPFGASGSFVRRIRSSEYPFTSVAGTYWLKARGLSSASKHTASSSPSSRGSKIRLKVMEYPRSASPWRVSVMSSSSWALNSSADRRPWSRSTHVATRLLHPVVGAPERLHRLPLEAERRWQSTMASSPM